ncbi:serine protease [Lithospermum erythrorhizon]|uniref:Serine protease n=1 Tax=Lithospermum erythrorhizon TaxID=34254 RepID=A0AAV3NTY4_LITER
MKNSKALLLILLCIYLCSDSIVIHANKESNVYIAYLGDRPHDDHHRILESHHDLLASVVGSKEEAAKCMVHNYKYGFSGFSAKLTEDQAKQLAAKPDVIHLLPDLGFKPQARSAPDYLGLSAQVPQNILQRTNKGEGIIIGVVDTGIWANNSKAFSDEGYGPIPARWKGKCETIGDFDASQHCNRKIIGAYWHRKGATARGFDPKDTVEGENPSPLDFHGHGTHCASNAAGSEVINVTHKGHNYGTFSGIAPRAHLAIYKACFNPKGSANKDDDCLFSDVVEAFDQAIHDGVDIISASIGVQHSNGNDVDNYLNFAAYHATMNGIIVVAAAGNLGPGLRTMGNSSPWHITVAASSLDDDRTEVPDFSGRGPSRKTPVIIKPDITAPGKNILAAGSPKNKMGQPVDNGFQFLSGTSMATPMVAGLAALLKSVHSHWSPAAIKSAFVTTGVNTSPHGGPIVDPKAKSGLAGPLEIGGGIANVNSAADPGLIYDMYPIDYLKYLCGVGYSINDIRSITRDQFAVCPPVKQSLMNVNLPSIGISGLQSFLTITRTVTNVGPSCSTYIPQINSPPGTKITVSPNVLVFDRSVQQITFHINIEKVGNVEENAAGSLTWTDGVHNVRSPIVVLS